LGAQEDKAIRAQAQSMLQAGHIDTARELLRQHVTTRSRDHEAWAILGQIATMGRRFDEAESMVMRALRGDRKRADYHALLGEVLLTSGRHKEAIGRFEQATRLHAGYDAAFAGMAESCLRMGDPERALTILTAAPDTPVTAVPHARALNRQKQYDEAIALIRRHLPAGDRPVDVQRGLWFALAAACERTGRYAEAAEAATEGNARSTGGWSHGRMSTMQQEWMEVFSTDRITSLPKAANEDTAPVFIVGLLRSGSTLTEQILDAHSQGHGAGELEVLPQLLAGMQQRFGTMLPWPALLQEVNEQVMDTVATDYLSTLRNLAPRARRIADKQLGNLMHLGAIQLLFPRARVVHCVRHPMDLGLSCWMQKLPPGTNPWACDLKSIAEMIRCADEMMDHWRHTLDLPILEVRYENLVEDLEGQTHRLLDFCDLPFEEQCLRFWETGRTVLTLSSDQVRQPIYASSVGRHTPWGEQLSDLRDALGDSIERYEQPEH